MVVRAISLTHYPPHGCRVQRFLAHHRGWSTRPAREAWVDFVGTPVIAPPRPGSAQGFVSTWRQFLFFENENLADNKSRKQRKLKLLVQQEKLINDETIQFGQRKC